LAIVIFIEVTLHPKQALAGMRYSILLNWLTNRKTDERIIPDKISKNIVRVKFNSISPLLSWFELRLFCFQKDEIF
jgi:hypothetical protein